MEPAKVSVVPNSPSERANASPAAETSEGATAGKMICRTVLAGVIPTAAAEEVISGSSWRSAASRVITTKGSAINTCAATTPGRAKANCQPSRSKSGAAMPRRPMKAERARPATTGGSASGNRTSSRARRAPRLRCCSHSASGTPSTMAMTLAHTAEVSVTRSRSRVSVLVRISPSRSKGTRTPSANTGRMISASAKSASAPTALVLGCGSGVIGEAVRVPVMPRG